MQKTLILSASIVFSLLFSCNSRLREPHPHEPSPLTPPNEVPRSTPGSPSNSPSPSETAKWVDIAMGESFIPGNPGQRVPSFYLATLDSAGRVYLKGAIEPFDRLLPDDVKTLESYKDYGLMTSFVEIKLNIKPKKLWPSYGSFFVFSDEGITHFPSGHQIMGEWKSIGSNVFEDGPIFLVNEKNELFEFDLKSKNLTPVSLKDSTSAQYLKVMTDRAEYNFFDMDGHAYRWTPRLGKDNGKLNATKYDPSKKWKSIIGNFGITSEGMLLKWDKEPKTSAVINIEQVGIKTNWESITLIPRDNVIYLIDADKKAFVLGHITTTSFVAGRHEPNLLPIKEKSNEVTEPTEVDTQLKFDKIVGDDNSIFAIDDTGKLFAWGNNYYVWDKTTLGILGVGKIDRYIQKPMLVIH